MNKRWLLPAVLALLTLLLAGCGTVTVSPYEDVPKPTAVITLEDGSAMTFILDPASAPNTVANFVNLANSGFYDGMKVDFIYPTFFLRSGDPDGDGTGGPGYTIAGEFSDNGFALNHLSHERGVISMCRLDNDPNSAGSQFFIMQSAHMEYNGRYAAFGYIDKSDVRSLNALDALFGVTLDKSYRPLVRQTIASIRVDTKGYQYEFVKYGEPQKPADQEEDHEQQ